MPESETAWTVIRPGNLIDALGGPPKTGQAVVIHGSTIQWVGDIEGVEAPGGPLASRPDDRSTAHQTLDYPDATLLPGLIDAHTHTNMPGDGRSGEAVNLDDTDDTRLLRSARNVGLALASGVTTVCDCGAWHDTAFSLRQSVESGLVPGSRVLVSGRPITITGGHLWYMGAEADGVEGVRGQVRQLIKQKADFIKVAASGGSTSTSDPFRPSFTEREMITLVEEAHNRGRPVAAHCRCTGAIKNALTAGVDMVLHCFFCESDGAYRFDQDTARRLADAGVWVNPTLHLGRTRRDLLRMKREIEELTPEEQTRLETLEANDGPRLERCARLIDAGVRLIGGSDCGWGTYPFGDFQGELIAMADAGLTPLAAIIAGTRDSAAAMGISDRIGTIEPGKEADLLVVEGDPSRNLKDLRKVKAVFRGGVSVPVYAPGTGPTLPVGHA